MVLNVATDMYLLSIPLPVSRSKNVMSAATNYSRITKVLLASSRYFGKHRSIRRGKLGSSSFLVEGSSS